MREMLEKLKDRYKPQKTEIILMCLFVLAFFVLNGRKLSETAAGLYGSGADASPVSAGAEGSTEEQESGWESELESPSGTERESFTPAELAASQLREHEEAAAGDIGEAESAGEGRGSETLPEKDESAVLQERLLSFTSVDFQIPMEMPEKEALTEYQMIPAYYHIQTRGEHGGLAEIQEFRPFYLLKRMVENRIAGYDGDWSVYLKDLKTDESFVVNDRPMKSASVMKLFILGTVYRAIENGELERTDEVVSLMHSMISVSDNEASNRLLYLLGDSSYADGIAEVDRFIRDYGFSDMTFEYNGFNDSDTVLDPAHNNQVSAKDCGKLLEDIYRRSWMNRAAAAEMEQMMLDQQTRYKIPKGLPEGVLCGNKTGEMDTTENDAAVVYGKECDYILVILSSDWDSKDQAISRIASMSSMVYEFLN